MSEFVTPMGYSPDRSISVIKVLETGFFIATDRFILILFRGGSVYVMIIWIGQILTCHGRGTVTEID